MAEIFLPKYFDDFWKATTAEALEIPLEYHRSESHNIWNHDFKIETFEFKGAQGEIRKGWIAIPLEPEREDGFPGFLWAPPYGRSSVMPNQYGTRQGYVSLSFNLLGHEAFHEENYQPERGYMSYGIEDPKSWIFREIYINCVIALRILGDLEEVNEDKLAVMGLSQGGGIALWLGTWLDSVKAICADLPFMADASRWFDHPVYRYPAKEIQDYIDEDSSISSKVQYTLSYYELLNHAPKCGIPVQLSYGLRDPACPPATVHKVFELLESRKLLVEYEGGHDWNAQMVLNNKSFLDCYL